MLFKKCFTTRSKEGLKNSVTLSMTYARPTVKKISLRRTFLYNFPTICEQLCNYVQEVKN